MRLKREMLGDAVPPPRGRQPECGSGSGTVSATRGAPWQRRAPPGRVNKPGTCIQRGLPSPRPSKLVTSICSSASPVGPAFVICFLFPPLLPVFFCAASVSILGAYRMQARWGWPTCARYKVELPIAVAPTLSTWGIDLEERGVESSSVGARERTPMFLEADISVGVLNARKKWDPCSKAFIAELMRHLVAAALTRPGQAASLIIAC